MTKKGLSSTQLRLIVISAMLLDHFVGVFISHDTLWGMALRVPGRIAAPIMCYMVSEGFHYTRNRIPVPAMYNGQKGSGSKAVSQFFYWFYPVHLLFIWVLKMLVL